MQIVVLKRKQRDQGDREAHRHCSWSQNTVRELISINSQDGFLSFAMYRQFRRDLMIAQLYQIKF